MISRNAFVRALTAASSMIGLPPAPPDDFPVDVYRPRFFTSAELRTIARATEAVIEPTDGSSVDGERAARHVDAMLASIDSPAKADFKTLLLLIEYLSPILVVRPQFFSSLPIAQRRSIVRFAARARLLRTLAKGLKTLACAGYYGDPDVMLRIGYVPFESRPRYTGIDETAFTYPDPFPVQKQ